jgi:hypothetical protein
MAEKSNKRTTSRRENAPQAAPKETVDEMIKKEIGFFFCRIIEANTLKMEKFVMDIYQKLLK